MSRREHNGAALIALALLIAFGVAGAAEDTPLTLLDLAWLGLAALLGRHGLRLTADTEASHD